MQFASYELLWLFFVYSVLGWAFSVAAAAVKRREFVNPGVLNLPVCPVYGIGAVGYAVFLTGIMEAPVFLFIVGSAMGAFLMVVTGVVQERIFHRKWWDNSGKKYGFGAFLTVPALLLLGVAALLSEYIVTPLALKLLALMPENAARVILLALTFFLAVDVSGSLAAVWKWRNYVRRVAALTGNMQMVSVTFGNAIVRATRRRLEKSYPNIETRKILETEASREKGKRSFAQGCCFCKLAWLFFIGSFIGDLAETVFCRFSLGWWMSRSSVVYGHFSIIWGLGCAMLTAFLYRYRDKGICYIFCYGAVVGGVYEYLCSVFTELVFGTIFWDYSGLPFNIGGRVNLLFCLFWGAVAVIWLKVIYPILSELIERIPSKAGPCLTWALTALLAADMLLSAAALARYSARQDGVGPANRLEECLDAHFPDERMEKIYPKAKFVK